MSAFEIEPPVEDTSEWEMKFSKDTLNVELTLKSGQPIPDKTYQFIAEKTIVKADKTKEYKHYWCDFVPTGKAFSFSIVNDLHLPRGQEYTFYVVPHGVTLVDTNRTQHSIGKHIVPLYSGNMIKSVSNKGLLLGGDGDTSETESHTVFLNDTVFVVWEGSYGVNKFKLEVVKNNEHTWVENYESDGPMEVVIPPSFIKEGGVGTLAVTGTVIVETEEGLLEENSTWEGYVVEKKADYSELVRNLDDTFFNDSKPFSTLDDLALDEMNSYYKHSSGVYASSATNLILNPTQVIEVAIKAIGEDTLEGHSTYAKNVIVALCDSMPDEYYCSMVEDCTDTMTALYDWISKSTVDEIATLFDGGTYALSEALDACLEIKKLSIDDANNGISNYIEYLLNLGFEEDMVMDRYAQIMGYQYKNLSKKAALNKVSNGIAGFRSGINKVCNTLGDVATFAEIMKLLHDVGVADYTNTLIKLNLIIGVLETSGNKDLLKAAQSLKQQYEERFVNITYRFAEYGLSTAASYFSTVWKTVTAGLTIVKDNARAVIDMAYLIEIDDALVQSISAKKRQLLDSGNNSLIFEIEQELHCLADCRALMNDLAIYLNKVLFVKIDTTTLYELDWRSDWYKSQHSKIVSLLKSSLGCVL